MLKFYPLFSGSSGNMYLVKSEHATILIDLGVTYKVAKEALDSIDVDTHSIDAVLVTHEHVDHTRGLGRLEKMCSTAIYTTTKTYDQIYDKYFTKLENKPNFVEVKYNTEFNIKDITVLPFKVSHDAVMPVGYKVMCEGKVITIATDLGYVDSTAYECLKSSDLSLIEANYDTNLLMYGPYPYATKMRIQSELGHLSNTDTSHTILNLAKDGKRDFILGHMSLNNNNIDQALFEVNSTLEKNGFNLSDFNINVATRDFSDEVYTLW